jgi:AcrR family transcriptional regulator
MRDLGGLRGRSVATFAALTLPRPGGVQSQEGRGLLGLRSVPTVDDVSLTPRQIELADAALRIVARQGMRAVTFRSVAAESGWSLGAVQKAFATKVDLHAAMFARLRGSVGPAPTHEPGRPTLHAWLVELVASVLPLDERRRDLELQGAAFAELAAHDPEIAGVIAVDDRRLLGLLEGLVRRGQAEGEIDGSLRADAVAWAVLAILQGAASQLLYDPRTESEVRELVSPALAGILHWSG